MTKFIHIRPVNGARVLDPNALPVPAPLPPEGAVVADTVYWRRRMKAREVELVQETDVAHVSASLDAPENSKEQGKGKGKSIIKSGQSVNNATGQQTLPPEAGQEE